MTPAEHYAEAERILTLASQSEAIEFAPNTSFLLGSAPDIAYRTFLTMQAQVHATLAQATDAHLRIGKPNASL